jgi:lipoate-protein ligase A
MEKWRYLDLTVQSVPLGALTVLPAVIRAVTEGIATNTYFILSVQKHGVTLGYHADAERFINIEYCKKHDIDMGRLLLGHGSVIYDRGNMIGCNVCDRKLVKAGTLPALFAEILTACAETFGKSFGINAYYRPLNDIQVGGKKVTGSAFMMYPNVVSCPIFVQVTPPDVEIVGKALLAPPEKFADKAEAEMESAEALASRAYSYEQAAGREISLDEMKEAMKEAMAKKFDIELIPGELTDEEKKWMRESKEKYFNDEWLLGSTVRKKLREIPPDVKRCEYGMKVPGGPALYVVPLIKEDKIQKIAITGSMHTTPLTLIEDLERALEGCPVAEGAIRGKANEILSKGMVGAATPDDFVKAIMGAVGRK